MTTHLDLARKSVDIVDNYTGSRVGYLEMVSERGKLEALISIAESLDCLRSVLESWREHAVPVITQEEN